MKLSKLPKLAGSKDTKTRIGRGVGSGHGGHASTRGLNGMKARTGGKVPWHFEGGQLPLFKRLPYLVGFKTRKPKNIIVKTSVINKLGEEVITPEILVSKGIFKKIPKTKTKIKVLFDEELKKNIVLRGLIYSKKVKSAN
ncbi:50S ribosomal protein L15 [Patescibacteria group bacterium]|nr:50S ribosomal protein L15 [Patescibacteria group bacterium]